MKTVINSTTGQVLYATLVDVYLGENELLIDEVLIETFDNPYFDFETRTFYNKVVIDSHHNIIIMIRLMN